MLEVRKGKLRVLVEALQLTKIEHRHRLVLRPASFKCRCPQEG